jgi:anti-sigma B factor antagonist
VTATVHVLPVDCPPPVPAAAPNPYPGAEFLTVTAHPVASGVVVITVRGEVDLLTGPLLLDALLAHLHGPDRRLIVDLTAVRFFGAAGLTVLATVRQATLAVGTGLCLVANTRPVLLPLTITGMHTQFDIYPDQAHAQLGAADEPGWLTP